MKKYHSIFTRVISMALVIMLSFSGTMILAADELDMELPDSQELEYELDYELDDWTDDDNEISESELYYLETENEPEIISDSLLEEEYQMNQEQLENFRLYSEGNDWQIASGSCGENVFWILDNEGLLTISGTGPMYDYSWEVFAPWREADYFIAGVVIEPGVTHIGAESFYTCYDISSVSIPDTVTSIGDSAFGYIYGLTEVQIPSSVSTIGCGAFSGCSNLTSITLPEGLEMISDNMFFDCASLSEINLPDSVTTIGEQAFFSCMGSTNLFIPANITNIGQGAFAGWDNLTTIIVDPVNPVYDSRDNCNAIIETSTDTLIAGCSHTIIPDHIKSIAQSAFDHCHKLTSIQIPYGVEKIGSKAFSDCENLKYVSIPETVVVIEDYAFAGCSMISDAVFLGSEKKWDMIEVGISNDKLTDSMATVQTSSGLEAVDITLQSNDDFGTNIESADVKRLIYDFTDEAEQDDISAFGQNVMAGDDQRIIVKEETEAMIPLYYEMSVKEDDNKLIASGTCGDTAAWALTNDGTLEISGTGEMTDYIHSSLVPWINYRYSIEQIVIQPGITKIGSYCFYTFPELKTVSLPDTLETINYMAFYNCWSLTQIDFPASLVNIGYEAFYKCTALTAVHLPNALKNLGGYCDTQEPNGWNNHQGSYDKVFAGCTSLEEVYVPACLEYAVDAFSECRALKRVYFAENIASIPRELFRNSGIEEIEIPATVTDIRIGAFQECSELRSVIFHEGLKCIEDYAFAFDAKIKTISLPESLENLGLNQMYSAGVFTNCTGLTTINIPENLKTGSRAFEGCNSLFEVNFAEGLETIPAELFAYSGLASITIPEGVKTIDEYAFSYCQSLSQISLPESLIRIGCGAFDSCSSLREVHLPEGLKCLGGFIDERQGNTWYYHQGYGYVFRNNSSLKEVTLPFKLEQASDVFVECSSLQTINMICSSSVSFYELLGENCTLESNHPDVLSASGGMVTANNVGDAILAVKSGNQIKYELQVHVVDKRGENKKLIITSGENPWVVELEENFEECVFQTASTEYNPRLSYYLAGIARAVYTKSDMLATLSSLGFLAPENQFEDSLAQVLSGYSIAKKTLPDGSDLVLVAIRGSVGYNWNNLLDIGVSWMGTGNYPAFENDAAAVYQALFEYLGGIPTSNTTYVLTGHSQGAGAANILAVMLHNSGVPISHVYDYNFACPNIACYLGQPDWTAGYNNIFNIGNAEDLVSVLPSNFIHKMNPAGGAVSVWGKYGNSYWFLPNDINQSLTGIDGHDMIYYLRALASQYSLTSFVSWAQAIASNAIKRIPMLAMTKLYWKVIAGCCPVDVVVYDGAGTPVAGVINNIPCYYNSVYGEVLIFVENDEKWFYLPYDNDYDIRITATDSGEMTYKVLDYILPAVDVIDDKTFEAVKLETGKEMYSPIENHTPVIDVPLYVMNNEENIVARVHEDGTEEEVVSGTCGEQLKWILTSDGVLSIYGSGEMNEYAIAEEYFAPWYFLKDQIITVKVKEGVTTIGSEAFADLEALTNVMLPSSIGFVSKGAFANCAALERVDYNDSTSEKADMDIQEGNEALIHAVWRYADDDHVPGDINDDGKVNLKDVLALLKYVNKKMINVVEAALDVNGDRKTNLKDVLLLLKYVNKKQVTIY